MLKTAAMALACGALSLTAGADEVWETGIGDVVYEADLASGWAVLSYPLEGGGKGYAYLEHMAGVQSGRSVFTGVWIEPDYAGAERCQVAIANPDTHELSHYWGRIELVFTKPDFPGGWVALRGSCHEAPTQYLVGTPKTFTPGTEE